MEPQMQPYFAISWLDQCGRHLALDFRVEQDTQAPFVQPQRCGAEASRDRVRAGWSQGTRWWATLNRLKMKVAHYQAHKSLAFWFEE